MKKIFAFLILFLTSFFILSCSDELTSPKAENSSEGKLSVTLDKESTPADVSSLKFNLSREGYSSITREVELSGESDYELLIEDISAGVWHVNVDALNTGNVVLYKGETDVDILPGEIAYVSLTLDPLESDSTGTVHIKINWGNKNWLDYPANPIFTSLKSPSHPNGIIQAKVIYDNNTYKMWYTNLYNSAVTDIGYAESVNGIIWKSGSSQPVLRGTDSAWDSYSVQTGAIIKVGEVYKMYYSGVETYNGIYHIGMATSSDGKNWTKNPLPVLYNSSGELGIHVDDVIIIDNKYYMYFSTHNDYSKIINLATSSDGINWERYSGNPVLTSSSSWEHNGVYNPAVINEGSFYRMIYMNYNGTGFGFAKSTDGVHWEKEPDNPFFTTSETHNFWTTDVAYPYFRKFNNKYFIYYTGSLYNNNAIGLLIK